MPLDTTANGPDDRVPRAHPTINDGAGGHSLVDPRGPSSSSDPPPYREGALFCGHVEARCTRRVLPILPEKPARLAPNAFPPGADLFCCHYVQIPERPYPHGRGSELHRA